jgi:hypothetical protein
VFFLGLVVGVERRSSGDGQQGEGEIDGTSAMSHLLISRSAIGS